MVDCKWLGPRRGESNARSSTRTRRRKQKTTGVKDGGPDADSVGQWKQWLGLWAQTGRPLEEFWELSPAQTAIMFEARGWMKKRAGAEQLMAFASQMGMSIQKK